MDRKVGQPDQEHKSAGSSDRTIYAEPRRAWQIQLSHVFVDGRRLTLATARKGDRWLVLTPDPTAHGALERVRNAIDDADTIAAYLEARDPDVTRVGGRHFLRRGGRR